MPLGLGGKKLDERIFCRFPSDSINFPGDENIRGSDKKVALAGK